MGKEEFYILSPGTEEEEFYILSTAGKETQGGISTPRIRKDETKSGISTPRIVTIRMTLTVGRFDYPIWKWTSRSLGESRGDFGCGPNCMNV